MVNAANVFIEKHIPTWWYRERETDENTIERTTKKDEKRKAKESRGKKLIAARPLQRQPWLSLVAGRVLSSESDGCGWPVACVGKPTPGVVVRRSTLEAVVPPP